MLNAHSGGLKIQFNVYAVYLVGGKWNVNNDKDVAVLSSVVRMVYRLCRKLALIANQSEVGRTICTTRNYMSASDMVVCNVYVF